ncbi:hypothetical protein H0H92_000272 [Tricholoma furcatifolium]|nr:hypothetical protein H0H92_000272 [Tricholoma furcatifolium]
MDSCLEDPRHQLVELEAEILRVQALLSKLTQTRVPLKRAINRRFSPMLSLPIELCWSASPLLLGKVCTAWRNLAWSMPWLWNNMSLSIIRPTETHIQLLEEWIARSGNLPLYIHLKIRLGSPDANTHVTRLMDVVARCSERWRSVHFDLPFIYPTDTYLSDLGSSNFPILVSAAIQIKQIYTPLNMFVDAPQLRNVQLIGFPRHSFELPWDHITHLRLNPTTVQQCLEVLGLALNLTHCVFEEITRSDVLNPTPVIAPCLQHLEIISFSHTPLSELLDTLIVPCAQNLSFHVTGNIFSHWSFISFIARSGCEIRHLALNAVRMSEWQLWDCLRATPSLVSLHLIDLDRVTNDTIRVLNPLNHAMLGQHAQHMGPLLPLLREFTYQGMLEPNCCALANTAQTRWAAPGVVKMDKLAFVTGSAVGSEGKSQLGRLKSLVEEGMDITLVTREGTWI